MDSTWRKQHGQSRRGGKAKISGVKEEEDPRPYRRIRRTLESSPGALSS